MALGCQDVLVKGNQQEVAIWITKQCHKIQRFCEEVLSVLLHICVPLILAWKSWTYFLFLAGCRVDPSTLWIREGRAREIGPLGLAEPSRTSTGTKAVNTSVLKGVVSAVIWNMPNVCWLYVGPNTIKFVLHTQLPAIWDESQQVCLNQLQRKNTKGFMQKHPLAWPEWVHLLGSSDGLQNLKLL